NARAFARSLNDKGVPVEGEASDGFTETHQVLIRVKKFGPGMAMARRLEDNNILSNYQALPDDATFLDSSGIRLGVQEMTRFGMMDTDFDTVAGYIAEALIKNAPVKDEIKKFRRNFLEMKYCLPASEALPLAARVLKSAFPAPGFAEQLADNLRQPS
ncbi:MAG: hypothetical protein MUP19_03430, partial [Candidatus Aminicenantes bacterium]|nr:hypothetical protein [Candidatus Aminicenantes bacterium]